MAGMLEVSLDLNMIRINEGCSSYVEMKILSQAMFRGGLDQISARTDDPRNHNI